MNPVQKIKASITQRLIRLLSGSSYFTNRFFASNRNLIMKNYYEYPSVINNGFVHIDRVVELAKSFGKTDKKIIIDAGAANGVISKMFSDQFPGQQVYAFEPIKRTYLELEGNVAGYLNIKLFNMALGSKPGNSVIHVLDRITSSSILEVSDKIDDPFFAESLKERETESITITTLDIEVPLDKNVSILKMDVQGFELEILKGGINTLNRTDLVVLEMQNHQYYKNAPMYYDLDKFMREHNFICWDLIPSIRKNNKLMEWDAIYISRRLTEGEGG